MPAIAIVGASANPAKFGNKAVRAYLRRGWTVYPINPREQEIEGLPVLRSARELPAGVGTASLYLQPELVPAVLEDLAAVGVGEVYLNPGTESDEAVAKAEELGLRAIVACSIIAASELPH
ncbi:MAG: CoA-binding protein [Candidatus Sumerlaeia bacterium]|nr:CoA-binding protein [Candidatus Sumerlaeia bacterium]